MRPNGVTYNIGFSVGACGALHRLALGTCGNSRICTEGFDAKGSKGCHESWRFRDKKNQRTIMIDVMSYQAEVILVQTEAVLAQVLETKTYVAEGQRLTRRHVAAANSGNIYLSHNQNG